ncbi:hypothetical protein, partial [Allorhizobium undicola]|uniref:hypothetical protein n=1 Tax=Allorhizobium undicola TaxID=78527 RepID=UPI003D355831
SAPVKTSFGRGLKGFQTSIETSVKPGLRCFAGLKRWPRKRVSAVQRPLPLPRWTQVFRNPPIMNGRL